MTTFAIAALLLIMLPGPAQAFTVVKIVGAFYLAWLGVHMLREAVRSRRSSEADQPAVAPQRSSYLRQGFLSNALNPKVALFFVTFLPQFLAADGGSPRAQALLLSAVFAGLYLAWFSLYVVSVEQL